MAIPKINDNDIKAALKFIDENGVPERNRSSRYELVSKDGKVYPPKYVIAVADHLANGGEIDTGGFNAVEVKNYFEARGYVVKTKSGNERENYPEILRKSKNVIFRGAPGTGKTYLAKEIAAKIVSGGACAKYSELSEEQKARIEFVQFHPSYDYSDFVEGLRPKTDPDGSMGFELQQGTFSRFATKARENFENSRKSKETLVQELTAKEKLYAFLDDVNFGEDVFEIATGNEFYISGADDKYVYIEIPNNKSSNKLRINNTEIIKILESGQTFEKGKDITKFLNNGVRQQKDSYTFVLYNEINNRVSSVRTEDAVVEEEKEYVFIIDEINRGEISKILGELFFSIDPGYRGEEGAVSTQYANLHDDPNEKFYVPENLYIIGTMNDIDRSVDSFDFAMRRRFRFIEVTADDSADMLVGSFRSDAVEAEARKRMKALNAAIVNVDGLNENYQIGAAYFMKAGEMSFDELWTDSLQPLLQDYVRGMYGESEIMKELADAYGYADVSEDDSDED